jgi:hypothetical protein
MALSLSHKSGTLVNLQPKSLKVSLIQSSWAQQAPTATYSASAVERATKFCFMKLQDTKDLKELASPGCTLSIYFATGIVQIGEAK